MHQPHGGRLPLAPLSRAPLNRCKALAPPVGMRDGLVNCRTISRRIWSFSLCSNRMASRLASSAHAPARFSAAALLAACCHLRPPRLQHRDQLTRRAVGGRRSGIACRCRRA
jgi:hypothetical protein